MPLILLKIKDGATSSNIINDYSTPARSGNATE